MRKPKEKLPHPYSYYYKSYSDWKCPFCGSDNLVYSGNRDLVFCSGYHSGGYVTENDCEASGVGQCVYCWDAGKVHQEFVTDEAYLCGDCYHGINFSTMELITHLFSHKDDKPCKHCQWHKDKTSRL